MSICTTCRICKSTNLDDVISLGDQYITSRFPILNDWTTPKINITLCLCNECYLLQLRSTTDSSQLYEFEYGYNSGISNTMRKHLKDYQEEILSISHCKSPRYRYTILDIGSNDSTMLNYYPKEHFRRIGIDPTGKQFKENYIKNSIELLPDYFTYNNFVNEFGNIKCNIVSSISMFYDLPDPVQFAKDIHSILDENGIWTCEQSYLLSMMNTNSIDTICHEHLEYYSLHQIKEIADRSNFKIIDVKFNNCNGGSFRIYFAKKSSELYNENTSLIKEILDNEKNFGLTNKETYIQFLQKCDNEIEKLKEFISLAIKNNKTVYIYGASTKGNCLLQYGNIGSSLIKYAVERNLKKVGKMTSTGIEIISEETMRKSPPDYLLVLPWHFRTEIIQRENTFLENGGQFIFPFPNFEIIGTKQKVLITGCNGLIASHFINTFNNNYYFYGISKSFIFKDQKDPVVKIAFDLNNYSNLKEFILLIKPNIIIHLAGISSSIYSDNILEILNTNGLICANICDIIHNNKLDIKLFNASSSDMYKGHHNFTISENDTCLNSTENFKHHLHPYSIAKIFSSNVIDFYRHTFKLPFSNGIIFTTESKDKKDVFLLKKLSLHIKKWKNGDKQPLVIGNLDSYRSFIHVSDTVNAINLIINQNIGDTYVISNVFSYKIYDIVIKLYKKAGIYLIGEASGNEASNTSGNEASNTSGNEASGNEACNTSGNEASNEASGNEASTVIYEKDTNLKVLITTNTIGTDTQPIIIKGNPQKLKKLNWNCIYSIDDILNDYLS